MEHQEKQPKICQTIVGYDANALYLWAIMQNMPTGAFTRRREETGFKRESSSKMATEWLEWEAERRKIHICHQMNGTEKRIGERRLPRGWLSLPISDSFSVPRLLVAWPYLPSDERKRNQRKKKKTTE